MNDKSLLKDVLILVDFINTDMNQDYRFTCTDLFPYMSITLSNVRKPADYLIVLGDNFNIAITLTAYNKVESQFKGKLEENDFKKLKDFYYKNKSDPNKDLADYTKMHD